MKRLYMLAITSLLVAACAEDIDNNNLGKPLISFGVNEPYAAVADSNEPAVTRSFNATDAFTPDNGLFSNAVYASDADKQSAANRVQVEPLEGDYPQELCMLVSKEPWPQPSTATRATENTTAVLNASGKQIGIYSSIYSGNADYSTSSSKFEPTTATAWPTTGSSSTAYDIYAWHPTTFTSTGISMSGQTFTYTLPTTSAAMVDLIGTKESHSYSENNDGSISLTFNHLLAPVCFKLAAGLSGTITSIKFSNIVTTGTYTLGATHADDATYGYTWTATTTGAYTASVSGTGGASEVQVDGSHYFMMIPQTVAAGVVVTITITDGASQSNTLTYTVPSGGQVWKAGQVTTYTISTSTITSFTLTYPQWTESGGSGTTYGPVDNYDVTTEDYGYVGLFAVDKANKIVISNAKVKITSAASHVGTCDLTDAANTSVLGNYILSQNYTYYVMYPYSTTATGLSTLAAGTTSPGSDADTFFANVTDGWMVTANNTNGLADYKASDLQIAKVTIASSAGTASMVHKMGLAEIELKTATYNMIVEDNSVSPYTTPNRTTNANINVTASSTFNTSSPYHIPTRKESTSLYYAVVPTGTNSTQFNSTTGIDQWSSAITTTGISSGGVGHYDVYSTRVGTSTYSGSFSYHGTYLTFTVPFTGKYTIECWGASGGYGGKGGYVCGSIDFEANTTLYVYIGQEGAVCGSGMSFNGGGYGRWSSGTYSGCGGGATDVRLTKHSESDGWSGNTSLYSRIIVAGGGGGGLNWYMYGNSISTGANAGGINGYDGIIVAAHGYESQVSGAPSVAKGGSQTGGGAGGAGGMYANGQNGGLGYGGSSNTTYRNANGAGGGGYYGGGASGEGGWCAATGAGGSSFISGMAGCNGWDNQQNNHAGSSNPTKILVGSTYKTFSFSNCEMIDGAHSMPNPVSSGNEAGHSGNGYCRITGTTATSNL